ncbi:MAG: hypothetical protein IZT59_03420 [Verrucomicrobia bacterium]|mgnify:CR=1 FL=1|nr:hypothetical protein [Verrucomicrobiota bacterium]
MKPSMKISLAALGTLVLASCAGTETDPSRPAVAKHKSMSERLKESGGYKQDTDGSWVPKSDKRSPYDSQRNSPYFKGKVEKDAYKTGDYAKKSWWGSKDYGKQSYEGSTEGSRFERAARQEGRMSHADGQKAKVTGPFETNTLGRKDAHESRASAISRPADASVQSQRRKYKAPSVIDWREQRKMSVEQSRGILGR